MSAKSQRLRRRLEVSESQRLKLLRLLKIGNDKEAVDKIALRLAQTALHAWNNDAAFGNDYFKGSDGKRIVKKVSAALESLLSKKH